MSHLQEPAPVLAYATPQPGRPKAGDIMLLKCLGTCHLLLGIISLPTALTPPHRQPGLDALICVCGTASIVAGIAMCLRRNRWLALAASVPNLALIPCLTLFALFTIGALLIPSVGACFARPLPALPSAESGDS